MDKCNGQILLKTYLTVAPITVEYFKHVWLERNKLSERQFRNRLKNPTLDDILLFCHVCKLDLNQTLKPFATKFKNIPPFDSSPIQLTLE